MPMLRRIIAALILALLPATAAAQTQILDEVKIGVLANDIAFLGRHVEAGTDVNFETLFKSPDLLGVIGSPRRYSLMRKAPAASPGRR